MRCNTCNHNKWQCKHEIDELLSPQLLPTSIQHEEEEKEDECATERDHDHRAGIFNDFLHFFGIDDIFTDK